MLAKARRHQNMLNMFDAVNLPHATKRSRKTTLNAWQTLAQGPSRPMRWEDTLTPEQKVGLEKCERETAETIKRLSKRMPKSAKLDIDAFKKAAAKATKGLRKAP